MIPVILSGGSGTRLWPVSRQHLPKQFAQIFDRSLQTMTLLRAAHLGPPMLVTGKVLQTLTELNLRELHLEKIQVVYEPCARNTAPAIAAICHLLQLQGQGERVAGIFPSDHLIQDEKEFLRVIAVGEKLAQNNQVVTIGIQPTYPETGYGYIQTEGRSALTEKFSPVTRFHEKPDLQTAQKFLASGDYFWNAGIFIFKISHMIGLFQKHQPLLWKQISQLQSDLSNIDEVYGQISSISIDYAIMEKLSAQELSCVPGDFGWNDVGSWDAVASLLEGDEIYEYQSENNFVFGRDGKTYALVGVEDLILVDTADALLVAKKGCSQDVRQVVDQLSQEKPTLLKEHVFESRPWGDFEVLRDTEHFKSKVIQVRPHSQLSYQSHAKREEHWIITRGVGEVVLNDQIIPVRSGVHVHVPLGAKHRMRNTGSELLEFVEVQLGTYFGEDDIVRYQDDYKRT